MTRVQPPTLPPGARAGSLTYDHAMHSDGHSFPLVDGNQLVGLVTLDDVCQVERDNWDVTLVDDIMAPADELVTVRPQDAAELSRH